jgi:non-homologous end joining protein Ku
VNIPDDYPDASEEKLQQIIENKFKTQQGKRIAQKLFINAEQ